jgi:hypothetical protein
MRASLGWRYNRYTSTKRISQDSASYVYFTAAKTVSACIFNVRKENRQIVVDEISLDMHYLTAALSTMSTFEYEDISRQIDALSLKPSEMAQINSILTLLRICMVSSPDARPISSFFGEGHVTIIQYVSSPFYETRSDSPV